MAGLLVAGLAAVAGPTLASTQASDGMHMHGMDMSETQMSDDASPTAVHRIDLTRVFGSGTGDVGDIGTRRFLLIAGQDR